MISSLKKYRVLLDDSRQIQFNQAALVEQCCELHSVDYSVYQSFNFVEGTGYMKTVGDEIEFVLASHQRQGVGTINFDDFVEMWQFESYVDRDIRHLSGGWKKFLGLALFTVQRSAGKVYFDACRQLSDRLIRLLVRGIDERNTEVVFFFEYDTTLLTDRNLKDVWLSQDGLSADPPTGGFDGFGREPNYEHKRHININKNAESVGNRESHA